MSTYTERTTLSNRYMSIDLLFTTGSGVRTGTHGRVLGTGVITRAGGTYTAAGHMIGTGIIAMRSIITTTIVRSVRDVQYTTVIMTSIEA